MAERLGAAENALMHISRQDAFAQLVAAKTRLAEADYAFLLLQARTQFAAYNSLL
jgi:hypothetical protein